MRKLCLFLFVCLFVSVGIAAPKSKPVEGCCDEAEVSRLYAEGLEEFIATEPVLTLEQAGFIEVLLHSHLARAEGGQPDWYDQLGILMENRIRDIFSDQEIDRIFAPILHKAKGLTDQSLPQDLSAEAFDGGVMFSPIDDNGPCDCAGSSSVYPDCTSWRAFKYLYCCRKWPQDACNRNYCCGATGEAPCTGMCRSAFDC